MIPRRVLLRNLQSPGDVLMLTAAVRDLHRQYPGQFLISVATSASALWENNPYIVPPLAGAEEIVCGYPLIHQSNSGPWHFIHAFHQFLAERLGIHLRPTDFRGDVHISSQEASWISQVHEITGMAVPFWIVVAGGKSDFTAKWWHPPRMQAVVNHFKKRILFVQIGERGHHHPPLRGVLDLRGRTDLRQLIRLMHHAQGCVCPVTFAMHLAAAVETRGKSSAFPKGMPRNRPCVVIAGGREPAQWEAYPHHQYIHTNGALRCCDNGGCWKSRVLPLGDGDRKDGSLCLDVVELSTGIRKLGIEWSKQGLRGIFQRLENQQNAAPGSMEEVQHLGYLPKCLEMITSEEVIRRVESYFAGGAVDYLSSDQVTACREKIDTLEW